MIKFLVKALLLTFLVSFSVYAQGSLNTAFQKANQAYQADQYQKALELYRQILSNGYENAELYYNMGNCYYRMNRVGEAVLYFEKAFKLNPHDLDIRHNLDLVNLKVVDRVDMPPRFFLFEWWDSIKIYYSIDQLSYLFVGLFVLSIVLFIAWLFAKRDRLRRLALSLTIVLGVLAIFWGYIFYLRAQEYKHFREAVILTPAVTVQSAPDTGSTEVFILHEGAKVSLDEQREAWVKISLPDGKSGWIRSQALGVI